MARKLVWQNIERSRLHALGDVLDKATNLCRGTVEDLAASEKESTERYPVLTLVSGRAIPGKGFFLGKEAPLFFLACSLKNT